MVEYSYKYLCGNTVINVEEKHILSKHNIKWLKPFLVGHFTCGDLINVQMDTVKDLVYSKTHYQHFDNM